MASMLALAALTACGGGSFHDGDPPPAAPLSTAPEITSVTAASAKLGEPSNFVVTGKNLTGASVGDKENNCDPDPASVTVVNDTTITFTCTPQWFTMSFAAGKVSETSGTQESLPVEFDLAKPRVTFETTAGDIVVELEPRKAPETVLNFLTYASEGYYDGTIFHRILNGSVKVVQGGGFTGVNVAGTDLDAQVGTLHDPIELETDGGLSNTDGTIAMARLSTPTKSATSQFFFNASDNHTSFDASSATPGYAVFGHIVSGRDKLTVIQNGSVRTTPVGIHEDVPDAPVTITKATVTINP